MGIPEFTKLLKDFCSSSFKTLPLSSLNGYRISVDSSMLMYRYKSAAITNVTDKFPFLYDNVFGWDLPCKEEILEKFKILLKTFFIRMKKYEIDPIFVLDGPPPPEKLVTKLQRSENGEDKEQTLQRLRMDRESLTEYRQCFRSIVTITDDDKNILISLAKEFGYKVFQSSGEAESTCALLTNKNITCAAYSKDTDLYAYGCRCIIKEIDSQTDTCTIVSMDDILKGLDMTQDEVRLVCSLLINDYNKTKVDGYSSKSMYKIVKECGTLEKVREKYPILEDIKAEVGIRIFSNPVGGRIVN